MLAQEKHAERSAEQRCRGADRTGQSRPKKAYTPGTKAGRNERPEATHRHENDGRRRKPVMPFDVEGKQQPE